MADHIALTVKDMSRHKAQTLKGNPLKVPQPSKIELPFENEVLKHKSLWEHFTVTQQHLASKHRWIYVQDVSSKVLIRCSIINERYINVEQPELTMSKETSQESLSVMNTLHQKHMNTLFGVTTYQITANSQGMVVLVAVVVRCSQFP